MSENQPPKFEDLTQDVVESLDDETRRKLLRKIAGIGAAGVPLTVAILSADAALAASGVQGGTGLGGPGGPGPGG